MEALGTVNLACDEATERLSRELGGLGLDVVRSFDLQSARRALRDPEGCPCPSHGNLECTCQYIVLLVHPPIGAPLTLIAHGHGGKTRLSLDDGQAKTTAAGTQESVKEAVGRLEAAAAGA